VTVEGGLDVVPPPQAATVSATVEMAVANCKRFPFTVGERSAAEARERVVSNCTSACCTSGLTRGNARGRTHSQTSSNYLCTNYG